VSVSEGSAVETAWMLPSAMLFLRSAALAGVGCLKRTHQPVDLTVESGIAWTER